MAKTPGWFKMFLSFTPLINAVPSENVGEGVKLAMNYFRKGALPAPDTQEMSMVIFDTLKDSIDQAFADCDEKSEKARRAVMTRWHKEDTPEYDRIRPNTPEYDRIRPNTEEKRIEEKREEEIEDRERTTTTIDTKTEIEAPAGNGGMGGGFPPDILDYARRAAQGAKNPAAYQAAILDRIREAGYSTLAEVLEADRQRKAPSAQRGDTSEPEPSVIEVKPDGTKILSDDTYILPDGRRFSLCGGQIV